MLIDILALDIATTTGFARGRIEQQCVNCGSTQTIAQVRAIGGLSCCPERRMQLKPPTASSFRFGHAGASDNAVFGNCLTWIARELEPQPRPDMVIIESLLPPTAKVGFTTSDVRDRLCGLHGIVRSVAYRRGIHQIAEYSVGDVRAHFIGDRRLRRADAKRETVLRCRQLGWDAIDDNAADALALWSFAVALLEPSHAMTLSPLFNKNLRAAE
jgi:hypothetical protein